LRSKVRTYVIGVGITDFQRAGTASGGYPELARQAGTQALADAGIPYHLVEYACASYAFGESCSGHRAMYELGLTGIPITDVSSNCSSGSSALYLAGLLVRGGTFDCALAIGFETMNRGPLQVGTADREPPTQRHFDVLANGNSADTIPAAFMFGTAAAEHMTKYSTTTEQFARIAEKNYRHALANPRALAPRAHTLPEILDSSPLYGPITKLQCAPPADGAAAVLLASERFVEQRGLAGRAVEIAAQSMVTDTVASFAGSAIDVVGYQMANRAARDVYDDLGVGPDGIQVIEVHDCFSSNELLAYEALGLCPPGEGGKLIDSGWVTYGGKWVVNPSGGLLARGHPLGATGLAQCVELTCQLRAEAGARQVAGAEIALQHNNGIGGNVVLTAYRAPAASV
jgi:acetyl-CoA acyltransferase